ncbi:maestro heat-like repeat-containing protein family member 6 [Thamnophis elegans]|uniref:maestro heat-like repeat-containing protein family member 6 n=1 Tax=Thamnophis elegans TaxID=35005 RepID=UPI001378AEB7|nr:maestro heat-like repeat-containing protein family member 6 [Thamnophis elegans]
MRERILRHLVPFILHMYDPSQKVVETYKWTLARCSNFLAWNLGLEILTLPFCDCQKALDKISKSLVLWYPDKIVVFLSCTVNFLKSPKAPLRRAAGVFAGFLAFYMDAWLAIPCQEALIALQEGLDCLLTDPEPSIAEVASISILQVKEARRTASASPIPSALARMFCCLQQPGEKEKPKFEDSPYQRKRSQEAFLLSIPHSLH